MSELNLDGNLVACFFSQIGLDRREWLIYDGASELNLVSVAWLSYQFQVVYSNGAISPDILVCITQQRSILALGLPLSKNFSHWRVDHSSFRLSHNLVVLVYHPSVDCWQLSSTSHSFKLNPRVSSQREDLWLSVDESLSNLRRDEEHLPPVASNLSSVVLCWDL